MTWDDMQTLLGALGLRAAGGFCPEDSTPAKTIVMLAPDEPAFWDIFAGSDEYRDGKPHPMDRWSQRVIGDLANDLGVSAYFPFGGPPFQPFFQWALATGQVHQSPIRLLVDRHAGLFVAFRGALGFDDTISDMPKSTQSPCDGCDAPCLTTCPVHAFDGVSYAVDRCKAHVLSPNGKDNLMSGCLARRACPYTLKRHPHQARFHMRAFVGI